MRDVQNVSRNNEKNFKKQQEFLTNLNNQYTLVCEKLGFPTNVTFTKLEEVNDFLAKKARGEVSQSFLTQGQQSSAFDAQTLGSNTEDTRLREDPERLQKKVYEEQLRELQANEVILQKQLQSLEKKFQIQNTKLKGEIVNVESDCKSIESKIRQKELV